MNTIIKDTHPIPLLKPNTKIYPCIDLCNFRLYLRNENLIIKNNKGEIELLVDSNNSSVMYSCINANECDYNKISPELSIFIASIAAATSVASLGNSKYIEKNLMLKSIEYFLK